MDHEGSSFDELVETHQKRVFQVALSMVGDKDEALDITQDVFMRAFRSYKAFRSEASPDTWLIRITINRVRDYFRREKLRRLLFLRPGTDAASQINRQRDSSPSPEECLQEKQLGARLRAFQQGLKGREREVFALRFGTGYTIKEISQITGMSQSSAKTHLYRALEKARGYLADWREP